MSVHHGVLEHQPDVQGARHQQHELRREVQRQPVTPGNEREPPLAATANNSVSGTFSSHTSNLGSPLLRYSDQGGSGVVPLQSTRSTPGWMIESPRITWISDSEIPGSWKAAAT